MRLNAKLNRGLAAAALLAALWGLPAPAGAREPELAGPRGAGPAVAAGAARGASAAAADDAQRVPAAGHAAAGGAAARGGPAAAGAGLGGEAGRADAPATLGDPAAGPALSDGPATGPGRWKALRSETVAPGVAAASAAASGGIVRRAAPADDPDPDYAMWSRMAFKEARRLYTLLDYQYLGRAPVAPGVDQRQFRFWVRRHQREFPLIVTIRYNLVTHKVFSVRMEEQPHGGVKT